MHGMKHTVKLPYCSRYFSGELLNLGWLKAVTVNDNLSARRLEWHHHDELELIFPLRGHYQYEFKRRRPVLLGSDSFIVVPRRSTRRASVYMSISEIPPTVPPATSPSPSRNIHGSAGRWRGIPRNGFTSRPS